MRRERLRKRLQWAGLAWWGGLAWVGAIIAVSVAGPGDEGLFLGVAVGSGTIASGALLLAAYMVGRRNADWWRPRLREVLSSGTDGDGGSSSTRRSSGCRERARHEMAKQVRSQIREARIYERPGGGDATLTGEPILVLHSLRDRSLDVFDQEGNELGRIVRVLEGTSKSEGNVWIAEARDLNGQAVLAVRLAPRRRRRKHAPVEDGSYSICSADGTHLAGIGPPKKRAKGFYRPVTASGELHAHIAERSSDVLTVAAAGGRQIAEITIPSGVNSPSGWYVVNRAGPVDQPLNAVILAAAVVWADVRINND